MANAIKSTMEMPVRLASQFDKTNTTLATITGFQFDGLAGASYRVRMKARFTANAAGGIKFAINGSATFTDIRCSLTILNGGALSVATASQLTSKGTAVNTTGPTAGFVLIDGTVVVNAAGTVTIDMAEVSATGTASILAGAEFEYRQCQ